MIKLKDNVRPRNLIILAACANVAENLQITLRITSGNDSKHMKESKHYDGNALDIGCKEFSTHMKREILDSVMKRLNKFADDYDGLIEHEGLPNEHIHIEYDPKPEPSLPMSA